MIYLRRIYIDEELVITSINFNLLYRNTENIQLNLKFGDGDEPNLCRVKKK